jgi:hypothetical protein
MRARSSLKASELIGQLQSVIEKFGDHEVQIVSLYPNELHRPVESVCVGLGEKAILIVPPEWMNNVIGFVDVKEDK